MKLSRLLHFRSLPAATRPLVGHISDVPQVLDHRSYGRVMIFHIAEAADIEFHLAMLPTTPMRHRGDRVELTWRPTEDGTAFVETLHSAPDADEIHRRNAEYLRRILEDTPRA